MNPDNVDKNDPNDVQLQNKDIMYDIASSVEIQKVYEFKRVFDRLNDYDAIDVSHKDAQVTLGDTNDPFSSISMSKDFTDCHTPKQGLDGIRVQGQNYRLRFEGVTEDRVMLKVSHWKWVVRFDKWGKLNPSAMPTNLSRSVDGPILMIKEEGASFCRGTSRNHGS
ncbi:hypothetical protein Tco_0756281 [Tanacetum coccineum]